jgi:hypothetical protein
MPEPRGFSELDAQQWFLRRGLPSALPRRLRWRAVVGRSAPALVAWAVLMVLSATVFVASGNRDIDVEDHPTALQWVTLAVLVSIPPAMVGAGWLTARIRSPRARAATAVVAILLGVGSDWYGDEPARAFADSLVDLSMVAAILVATGSGLGAVLNWALSATLTHVRSAGRLMARALPVVLLTILVFFNSTVWAIATDLDTRRIVLVVAFMAAIAIAFLVSGLFDRLAPLMSGTESPDVREDLSNTPFAAVQEPEPDTPAALRTLERANILVVSLVSQIVQIVLLAAITGALFFTLGLIVLTQPVLGRLTDNGPGQSQWFGLTVPVSEAHVHMTIFLAGLTFMYVSARSVGDGEYRREFLDPVVHDLRVAVAARGVGMGFSLVNRVPPAGFESAARQGGGVCPDLRKPF